MLKKLPCICLSFVSMSLLDDCAPRTEWKPIYFPFFMCLPIEIMHTYTQIQSQRCNTQHFIRVHSKQVCKSLISWSKSVTSNIVCWWCMLFVVRFAVYYFFSPHFTLATFWVDDGNAIFSLSIRGMIFVDNLKLRWL